jgi:hypothetical protein
MPAAFGDIKLRTVGQKMVLTENTGEEGILVQNPGFKSF